MPESPSYRTQRVTAKDLEAGRIRIPIAGPTKALLPDARTDLQVILKGTPLMARYDPREGPDRERSGVISFGASKDDLRRLVHVDEVLRVSVVADDIRID